MKNIFIICLLILPAIVSAQSLLRPRRGLRQQQQSQLLEPLVPFAEAVEKAKANDPQGWYALAIHYAKGKEIQWDKNKARQCLQKANDLNYGNAVFISTFIDEQNMLPYTDSCINLRQYTGLIPFERTCKTKLFITNAADVAKIRAGYERAFKLGVSAATNELARFEKRVKAYQEKAAKENTEAERKAKNAKLIEGLL